LSQIGALIAVRPGSAPSDWQDSESFNAFISAQGRFLPVVGEVPKAAPNRGVVGRPTNGSLIITHRKHVANLKPDAACEEARAFVDGIGMNWRGFRFWLLTDGGRIIGGAAGIKPAYVDAGAFYPQGRDAHEELYIDLEWYGNDAALTAYVPGVGPGGADPAPPPPSGACDTAVQSYPDHPSNALIWTANAGNLPVPHNAKVWVFQNGQRLNPFVNQYSVIPASGPGQSTILINPLTHFDGADYIISAFT
jgi:hypothetical protein